MHEEIIAAIPQPQKHEDAVLEVAITYDAADNARVELRDLTWANGIGWYRQKTLSLDVSAADALLKSLGQARRRLNRREPERDACKVIPFPVEPPSSKRSRPPLTQEFSAGEMLKKACCERFKRKGRACKTCPTMAQESNRISPKLLQLSQKF